jgi:hypothetical protein
MIFQNIYLKISRPFFKHYQTPALTGFLTGLLTGLLAFSLMTITACTPDTQKIMTSVPYSTPISVQISAPAVINWQSGTIETGKKEAALSNPSGGLIGMASGLVIQTAAEDLRPSWYLYSYGVAQQAIFATSLRDALQNNHVFTQIIFDESIKDSPTDIKNFHDSNPGTVLIQLKFMDTAATVLNGKTQLFADVDLTLSGANRGTVLKHLSAQTAQDKSWVFHQTFLTQEKELSNQLMTQAIAAIQSWISLPSNSPTPAAAQ